MKKILASLLLAVFLLGQNFAVVLVLAAPDLPGAPDTPEIVEQPEEPDAPENTQQEETEVEEQIEEENEQDDEVSETPELPDAPNTNNDENTGSQNESSQTGNTTINTGEAQASGSLSNIGNTNVASTANSEVGIGGVTILNNQNGSQSTNTGSVVVNDESLTNQNNNASLDNSLIVASSSGKNDANNNVGSSTINTGDANTSGTILNSVNTNIAGAVVSEFNVVDDQIGDLILDYQANCISGCSAFGGVEIENTTNGSNSDNLSEVDIISNELTFQNNDAEVENVLDLSANTGDNSTSANTGGDNVINTGDANVSGSVLNFLNNNIAGNVIYGIVNIYGELIGDIVVPDGYVNTGFSFPVNMANTNNGSESQNSSNVDLLTSDFTSQFNDADIVNNLVIDANTGVNETNANTGGDNSIYTGDIDVDAQILNIANNNFVGGDWWIVLVNEAGNWVGRIFAPVTSFNGGSFAMSGGNAEVGENGDINIKNSGNGSGSENIASLTNEGSDVTLQSNEAVIVNNINLSANTGNNSANNNTGGDSMIKTGDANIQFNLINFLNNNFAGGNVFLTVVNVFGNWVGDFIAPGGVKAEENTNPAIGGVENIPSVNSSNQSSSSNNSSSSSSSQSAATNAVISTPSVLGTKTWKAKNKIASIGSGVSDEKDNLALADTSLPNSEKSKTKINLAWGLIILPGLFIVNMLRRRFLA